MQTKTLFSQHYLTSRLPDHPEWTEDPRPVLEAMRRLWSNARQVGDLWNEAQTEDEFVKPALAALGWAYTVQTKAGSKGQITRPDYALFASPAEKAEASHYLGQDDPFYGRVRAIAEAKYWGRPLSQLDRSGRSTWKAESNPSHQMVSYLVGTRVPWGILTNGPVWRLYSRDVSSTASEFYEVDLSLLFDLLPDGAEPGPDELDLFRRWWLFFRRDAFPPDGQGRSFLQRVHDGSGAYARQISDKLKELVFDQVVPEIAGGFFAYRRSQRGIQQEDDAGRREVYAATLSLLYKLLFLLYAEARGLLPVDNPGYREQSLTTLAHWAAERLDRHLPLSDAPHAAPRYEALLALFCRLDQGDPALGIPRYDGGLFDPSNPENRFLAEHKLSDRVVARAVDILVRDAGQPVDYAYISVRNLGAIYEGLLENRLALRPDSSGESRQVFLVNDKGERKASGSYYTPDYIVAYIVQHTLDPILDERQALFEAAMDRCATLQRRRDRTADPDAMRLLTGQLQEAEREAREAFLGIKCCDPAMGSGHFLVNAVDRLTDGIIQRLQVYHDAHPGVPWAWNPIQRLIERVRGDILAEMARQGIQVDPCRLDDTALLTRLVMKRCIYGVDLNPLAVELAKLSLWLHSFTVGAPLSFLDHHLRWGNSLLGSDVRTVEQAIQEPEQGQLSLFGGPFAGLLDLTGMMVQVAEQADATLADVRDSAATFARFQKELTPYKQVLDLWVSHYFDNAAAHEFLSVAGAEVLPTIRAHAQGQAGTSYGAAIDRARDLRREKRFFHWDLEFPEVFVDLLRRDWAQDPGFDVVLGNPPYVRQEQLTPNKPWFRAAYRVFHGTADLYAYFYERGVRLLRQGGLLGLITSNKFVRASYGQPLRGFLSQEAELQQMVDFGHAPIFPDADTFPCITVLRRPRPGRSDAGLGAEVCPFPREALGQVELAAYVRGHGYRVPLRRFTAAAWSLERPEVDALMDTVRRAGVPLTEFLGVTPYRGILTGLNEAFLVDAPLRERLIAQDPHCAALLKPYLRGQDIKRWSPEWAGLWMILLKSSENQDWPWSAAGDEAEEVFARTFPTLHRHLKPFEPALRKRQDHGRFWWELRSCVYYALFEQPKLVHTDITWRPQFALAPSPAYLINTAYLWPTDDLYLLAVTNSPLLWSYMWRNAQHAKDEALRLIYSFVETLPIAPPGDAVRAEVEPAVERLIALTRAQRDGEATLLNWLRLEFGLEHPGQRLASFAALDEAEFVHEVSRQRSAAAGHLTPADVQALRLAYAEHTPPLHAAAHEALQLELRLTALVNAAYGLTPEEEDLLWRTAPPRMPVGLPPTGRATKLPTRSTA